jgi:signal transduction histidine kinase
MDHLLDRAPCGFVTFGTDGVILDANSTLLRMTGASRADVIGKPFESLLTISSRIFYQTHFFPMLRMQAGVEEIFLTLKDFSGSGDVAVLVSASTRSENELIAYDCVLMRLSERRKWEDEMLRAKRAAEEANKAKSGLISMMSHDLRTPIGAIGGYCDLLTMGIRGPLNDAQLTDVQRIKRSTEYVLGLIEDVLNFARVNAGQVENFDMQNLTTDDILTRTETLIGPRIGQAGLHYRREACTSDARVIADPERLQQILLNLLTNAVKFTPAGGSVTVSCANSDGHTLINVSDTGRGIPADHIERIFEPFVQVPGASASGAQKGFGLGLAISRELSRRMNGDLTAVSTVGVGSTFTVRLQSP